MEYAKNKKVVISNHTDKFIEWIYILHEYGYTRDNIIIYDRTQEDKNRLEKYGTVIKSPNVGSNIYDIGRYIYENYENLEEYTIFLKCNTLQRTYTYEDRFRYALKADWYVPINTYPHRGYYPITSFTNEYVCVEAKSAIVDSRNTNHPKIKSILDLLNDLFYFEAVPDHIAFCAAANFVVPKNMIKKYSKNLYKKMMDYTDYATNPEESHMFERIMDWIWTGTLIEKV